MVGERKARKTDAWTVAAEAIWRTIPSRGLTMNSLRLGVAVVWLVELVMLMARVSKLETESSRSERAAEVLRSRPVWALASASPKPPMKRWREVVLVVGPGVKESSLSVARMSRTSPPATSAMGERANDASVEAPTSCVRTYCSLVRLSMVRGTLMEEKLWR